MTSSDSAQRGARGQAIQDKHPNFRADGKLFLIRCFACEPEHGRENWSAAVASGTCAWCGWKEDET